MLLNQHNVLNPFSTSSRTTIASVADLHAGAHDSVTDARVALALYRKHSKQWEQMLKRRDSGADDEKKKAAAEESEAAKAPSGRGGKQSSRVARADAEAEAPVENEFSQLLKRL